MSPLTREQALDALPALALGALGAEDRAQVLAAIERWPDLKTELARYGDATAILLAGLPPRPPSSVLKGKVLAAALAARPATAASSARIDATRVPASTATVAGTPATVLQQSKSAPAARKPGFWDWLIGSWQMPRLAVAALALALGLGAWTASNRFNAIAAERVAQQQRIDQLQADLRNQQTASAAERDALTARLNQQQQVIARLQAPDAVSVALASTGGASGKLVFAPQSREAVLVATNLQALAAGQTYQLWLFDAAGKPQPSVLFTDAGAGVLVASTQPLGSFANYAVSIEPRGGSAAPTGPVVLIARG